MSVDQTLHWYSAMRLMHAEEVIDVQGLMTYLYGGDGDEGVNFCVLLRSLLW